MPTILVFDSGLGGLTVFREIAAVRPGARTVYLADDERFPYGDIAEADLIARVLEVIGRAIKRHQPDLVVIACNTASTLALRELRATFTVPFVGTVPAIKPACAASTTKRVSVLGTRATVQREYTQALIRDHAQACTVTLVGSASLASLAEAALGGEDVRDEDILTEIAPCFVPAAASHGRTDVVVLACTHYPLLLDRLVRLAPWPVAWIDPAPAIARRVVSLLGPDTGGAADAEATMLFTSGRRDPRLTSTLAPFFGGRVFA